MNTSRKSSTLQEIAEQIYQACKFDNHTASGFDSDDRGDIVYALMVEIDYLMKESWRLAGGSLDQFQYPVHPLLDTAVAAAVPTPTRSVTQTVTNLDSRKR